MATTTFILASTYGVVGDGTTDNATPLKNFMNALVAAASAGSSGATGILPAGVIMTTQPLSFATSTGGAVSGIHIRGLGQESTYLQKGANIDLVKIAGSASGSPTHTTFCSLSDLTLDGKGRTFTGRLVNLVYADDIVLQRLHLNNNADVAIDMAELWDSHLDDLAIDNCGTGATPNIHVRSSQAASGFGHSTDNTNVLRLTNIRCEAWRNGALWMSSGVAGGNAPNVIWVEKFKAEGHAGAAGPAISLAATVSGGSGPNFVHMKNIYIYYNDNPSSFGPAISITALGGAGSIRDCHIGTSAGVSLSCGLYVWTQATGVSNTFTNNGAIVLDTVSAQYGTAPVGGAPIPASTHLYLGGGGPYIANNCYGTGPSTITSVSAATGVLVRTP